MEFEPVNLVPVRYGIVERIAEMVRERDLLPVAERNDAFDSRGSRIARLWRAANER